MGHGNQRPGIELVRAFMPVLVTSNFDEVLIKNERASKETPFSHYKYGNFFRPHRVAKSVVSGPIWPKFKLVRDFMYVLVTCKYKKDWIKNNQEKVETSFSLYKSMDAFCCHGNQGFDPICPKTLQSLSPTPIMLHIKFDQDWPTGFRDIQVQKCEIFVTQGQVTPKWVVWSGLKPNSTNLLCMSRSPATLMMSQSKMNELAWRPHFPIISLWAIF